MYGLTVELALILCTTFQTGFMTAYRSMLQHFSPSDNDCQRSSMPLENKHWESISCADCLLGQ